MKILINLSLINRPKTGIEHYTIQLVKGLLHHPQVTEIAGFDYQQFYTQEQISSQLQQTANANKPTQHLNVASYIKNILKNTPYARSLYFTAWDYRHKQKMQEYALKGFKYWEPSFIAHPYPGQVYPVIYDLSFIEYPQYHRASMVKWFKDRLPQTLSQAYRIQTISQFSQQQIAQYFHIPIEKIDVIPPGVDALFRPQTRAQSRPILNKYGLKPYQYLLSVATLEPRKNLQGLFKAWQQLPEKLRQQYPLVLVGKQGWLNQEFEQQIQPYLAQKQIYRLGHLPTKELPALYTFAKLFVYLSLYEGYGMPIAEALSCGTPVLAANTTAMPEAGRHYAHYVDPLDHQQIVQRLQALLTTKIPTPKIDGHAYQWRDSVENLIQSFNTPILR